MIVRVLYNFSMRKYFFAVPTNAIRQIITIYTLDKRSLETLCVPVLVNLIKKNKL